MSGSRAGRGRGFRACGRGRFRRGCGLRRRGHGRGRCRRRSGRGGRGRGDLPCGGNGLPLEIITNCTGPLPLAGGGGGGGPGDGPVAGVGGGVHPAVTGGAGVVMLCGIPFPIGAGSVPGGGDGALLCGKDLFTPGALGAAGDAGFGAGGRGHNDVYRVVDARKGKAIFGGIGFGGGAAVAGDGKAVEFFGAGDIAKGLRANGIYALGQNYSLKSGAVEKGTTPDIPNRVSKSNL